MNQKQTQRFGRAIASTILSFAAVSIAAVDKAQAAVLTYNLSVGGSDDSGFLKVSNSSLTGIGLEQIAVSEGRLKNPLRLTSYGLEGKEYYDLAGATALFYEGDFRGMRTRGGDTVTREIIIPPDAPGGPYFIKYSGSSSWSMDTNGLGSPTMWRSLLWGFKEVVITPMGRNPYIDDRRILRDINVSYTLVDTAAEPVPEPITFAGTALALAGLSWLKHKKKMAA